LRFKGERTIVMQPVADGLDALQAVADARRVRARQGMVGSPAITIATPAPRTSRSARCSASASSRAARTTSIAAIGRPMKDGRKPAPPIPTSSGHAEQLSSGAGTGEVDGLAEARSSRVF
jgi:hypothetical protein